MVFSISGRSDSVPTLLCNAITVTRSSSGQSIAAYTRYYRHAESYLRYKYITPVIGHQQWIVRIFGLHASSLITRG